MTNAISAMGAGHPGNSVFLRIRGVLEGLGLSIEEIWEHGTLAKGRVLHQGDHVANFSFSSDSERYAFNVHPPVEGSIDLVIQAIGRIDDIEPQWEAEQRDGVEALFRAKLVERGSLAPSEFPTDYALKKWVALAATIQLPKERGDRRYAGDEVVVRSREEPGSRFPSKGEDSAATVRAARLQAQSLDRERAIDIAIEAATHPLPDGDPADPASGWLAKSARRLIRGRMRDMMLAWEASSHAKVVTGVYGERDDLRTPYESTPAASSASP